MKPEDLALYDYTLPAEAIALHPAPERDMSRLLVMARGNGVMGHHRFRDLPKLLRAGDLLVLNETLAFPARLWARKVPTGGRVEIMLIRAEKPGTWEVLWRPHRRVQIGARAEIVQKAVEEQETAHMPAPDASPRGADPRTGSGVFVEVVGVSPRGHFLARFEGPPGSDLARVLDELGEPPLPPYIKRDAIPADRDRYQTVYARVRGSIAAPTAGMHFTPRLFEELAQAGIGTVKVVLHVGLPTFQPVTAEDLAAGALGEEFFEVPEETIQKMAETRTAGGRVVAVGTTVVRALESAWDMMAGPKRSGARAGTLRGTTRKFICPPYEFRAVDAMITNFHLPQSTLILLTAAFAGREPLLDAYAAALRESYRFASYGDAMLIY